MAKYKVKVKKMATGGTPGGTPTAKKEENPIDGFSDYSKNNLAYYTDPNQDFSGKPSFQSMGIKTKNFSAQGAPIAYNPAAHSGKLVYSADVEGMPTNPDGTPMTPTHVQTVIGEDGKPVYIPMYANTPPPAPAQNPPPKPTQPQTVQLGTEQKPVGTMKNSPGQHDVFSSFGGEKYGMKPGKAEGEVTQYYKIVNGQKLYISEREYQNLVAAEKAAQAKAAPVATPQMANGGEVPDLTAEELAQYGALTSEAEKASFLQSIGKTKVPYAAIGNVASSLVSKVPVSADNKNALIFREGAEDALSWAGKGAAIGANPALMAATGGLSLPVATAMGFIGGAVKGGIDGKKEYEQGVAEKRAKGAANIANAEKGIGVQVFAEGGEVKGPGGPKDDKIPAALPPQAFVVPAENAHIAEQLRKKYLPKKAGKADLTAGTTPVKLSDGEHMFTPEERAILESKGVDLDALAPNQEQNTTQLKDGGDVPLNQRGKIFAKDSAEEQRKKALNDAEKNKIEAEKKWKSAKARYEKNPNSWVNQRDYTIAFKNYDSANKAFESEQQKFDDYNKTKNADPDKIVADEKQKQADQKNKDLQAQKKIKTDEKKKNLSKAEKEYEEAKQEFANAKVNGFPEGVDYHQEQLNKAKQKRDSAQKEYDQAFKSSNEKIDLDKNNSTPENANNKTDYNPKIGTQGNSTLAATAANVFADGSNQQPPKQSGGKSSSSGKGGSGVYDPAKDEQLQQLKKDYPDIYGDPADSKKTEEGKTATGVVADPIAELRKKYDEAALAGRVGEAEQYAQQIRALGGTVIDPKNLNKPGTPSVFEGDIEEEPAPENTFKTSASKLINALGGPAGMAALAQTGIGLWQGQKSKRPIDKLDPTFNQAVQEAQNRAQYGFTEGEKSSAKDQIELARRNTNAAVFGMAGGNAGAALANARSSQRVANTAIVDLATQDARLKESKQGIADQMVQAKMEAQRRIFQDDLNTYNDNQRAAGALIQAGIGNFFGNLMYRDAKQSKEERDAKYGNVFQIPTAP